MLRKLALCLPLSFACQANSSTPPTDVGPLDSSSSDASVLDSTAPMDSASPIDAAVDTSVALDGTVPVAVRETAYLKAPTPRMEAEFGSAVAIDGNLAVVGAPFEGDVGRVFSYVRGDSWNLAQELAPPEGARLFGRSMALHGSTLIVAGELPAQGLRLYVYDLRETQFVLSQTLEIADAIAPYSSVLSLKNDRLVVGYSNASCSTGPVHAPEMLRPANEECEDSGAVAVFNRSRGSWSLAVSLKHEVVSPRGYFGVSVAQDGNRIVVGESEYATCDDHSDCSSRGAVYVFEEGDVHWRQAARILTHGPQDSGGNGERLGASVAIAGDVLLAGAPTHFCPEETPVMERCKRSGAVYRFHLVDGTWREEERRFAPAYSIGSFGDQVLLTATRVIVSATSEQTCGRGINSTPSEESCFASGAVFVYDPASSNDPTFVKASNADALDWFGTAVATDGTQLLVGASNEARCSQSTPANNDCARSGAAYSFQL